MTTDFESDLEQQQPAALAIFAREYWPQRFLSTDKVEQLRDMLYGAAMFTSSFSLESELLLLRDIAHEYILEAIAHEYSR